MTAKEVMNCLRGSEDCYLYLCRRGKCYLIDYFDSDTGRFDSLALMQGRNRNKDNCFGTVRGALYLLDAYIKERGEDAETNIYWMNIEDDIEVAIDWNI